MTHWTDSTGKTHELTNAKRLDIGQVAIRLNCSPRTVRRWVALGMLYPVMKHNGFFQIYEVGIADYLARNTSLSSQQKARR